MSPERPNLAKSLTHLKGFQRHAADYAFERLFTASDSTCRFLIADEVGLGKTMIARAIAALAIDHLWDKVERIDVVYICSNATIARQNVRRLGFDDSAPVDRITLLPINAASLSSHKLNFIAVTPGTSLEMSAGMGDRRERSLLFHMLQSLWLIPGTGAANIFQGKIKSRDSWREELREFWRENSIAPDLLKEFHEALCHANQKELDGGKPGLRKRWEETCHAFRHSRTQWPQELRARRRDLVSEFRSILARTCINALQPDLIILDEFQRFKHLLVPQNGDEAAELAYELFNWQDSHAQARVLLLSATPYKMYTLVHEEAEDDHYRDFIRTIEFLQRDSGRTVRFQKLLETYRNSLYRLAEGEADGINATCRAIEAELRRLMSRTERTPASKVGDGMLRTVAQSAVRLESQDVRDYVHLQRLGRHLDSNSLIEYWKSAPYLLSFLDGYQLDRRLEEAVKSQSQNPDLLAMLDLASSTFLNKSDIERFSRIDPANPRLRVLTDTMIESNLWHCLWLPPSYSTYLPAGPFAQARNATKRLVFSTWKVVPQAITSLLSYEVERRAFTAEDPSATNTQEARDRKRALLRFALTDDRPAGMPVLALMYPSPTLSTLGDHLLDPAGLPGTMDLEVALDLVEQRVASALSQHLTSAPTDGIEDEAWYWAAPILLDLASPQSEATKVWWTQAAMAQPWWGDQPDEDSEASENENWLRHRDQVVKLINGQIQLGRPPQDLHRLVAELALGGPGTSALRALWHVLPDADLHDQAIRNSAFRIGWGFRTLFNRPEATAIIRVTEREVPYWRMVLTYCCQGALSDVLAEYVHILREFEGLFDKSAHVAADAIAKTVREALTLHKSQPRYRAYQTLNGTATFNWQPLRGHFALRFGQDVTEDADRGQRTDLVRTAFNSPFWPFVLASTSVGQEGLDFHAYCHAVVHWNLPANPVDLEQREGRMHRFKGHAVRKNVARSCGDAVKVADSTRDIWASLFEHARVATSDDHQGLVPYWVYECEKGAKIERHVPSLPFSRDRLHQETLQRSLAVYRMVFGQPRQDDLVAFLLEHVSKETLAHHLDSLRVDLTPPTSGLASNEVPRVPPPGGFRTRP